jgi:hypothetical protein
VVQVVFASKFSVYFSFLVLHPHVTVVNIPYAFVGQSCVVCFYVSQCLSRGRGFQQILVLQVRLLPVHSSTFLFAFVRRSFWVSASSSVEIPPGVDDVGCIALPPVALTMSKAFFLSSIALKSNVWCVFNDLEDVPCFTVFSCYEIWCCQEVEVECM